MHRRDSNQKFTKTRRPTIVDVEAGPTASFETLVRVVVSALRWRKIQKLAAKKRAEKEEEEYIEDKLDEMPAPKT